MFYFFQITLKIIKLSKILLGINSSLGTNGIPAEIFSVDSKLLMSFSSNEEEIKVKNDSEKKFSVLNFFIMGLILCIAFGPIESGNTIVNFTSFSFGTSQLDGIHLVFNILRTIHLTFFSNPVYHIKPGSLLSPLPKDYYKEENEYLEFIRKHRPLPKKCVQLEPDGLTQKDFVSQESYDGYQRLRWFEVVGIEELFNFYREKNYSDPGYKPPFTNGGLIMDDID